MTEDLPIFVPGTKADAEKSLKCAQEFKAKEPYRARFALEEGIKIYNSLGIEIPSETMQLQEEIERSCGAYDAIIKPNIERIEPLINAFFSEK